MSLRALALGVIAAFAAVPASAEDKTAAVLGLRQPGVVDVTGAAPRLLRTGAVSNAAIAAALGEEPDTREPSRRGAPLPPGAPGSDA